MQIPAFYGKQEKASEWFRYSVNLHYQPLPLFILAAPDLLHFFNAGKKYTEVVSSSSSIIKGNQHYCIDP